MVKEIDASEAYNNVDALQTVIDNRRNICLIFLKDPNIERKVLENGLKFIEVEQRRHFGLRTSIIYRKGSEKEANRLYEIMKSHGGYVNDQTPEEAYEIGKLFGYTDKSIFKYIDRIYINENGVLRHRTTEEIFKYDETYELQTKNTDKKEDKI